MGKRLKKLLVGLLTAAFVATSVVGVDVTAMISYAATTADFNQLQDVFPIGTRLRSDMFPGLLLSFGGKRTLTVGEKTGNLDLSVTVLDEKLAAKSIPVIKMLFGPINITNKVGAVSKASVKLNPVKKEDYSKLVIRLGDPNISKLLSQMFDSKNTTAQSTELFSQFVSTLSVARDVQQSAETAAKAASSASQASQSQSASAASQSSQSDSQASSSDTPAPTPTPAPVVKQYNRVVLMFMDLCDLESRSVCGTKNLLDLLRADIPADTKVIVTTGGTLNWHMKDYKSYRDYTKNFLYPDKDESVLTPDEKAQVESTAKKLFDAHSIDLGTKTNIYEVVTGEDGYNRMVYLNTVDKYMLDKTYLTDFINFGVSNYKADKYDLIMGDHGSGISGFGVDEIYEDDLANKKTEKRDDVVLTLYNIKAAIENTDFYKGGNKFDFFGFDACQMGTVEVALSLKDTADYLILSQENDGITMDL